MDQRLNDLEERLAAVETSSDWHGSAKYVLEKLDELTYAIKENRLETCKKIEELKADNKAGRRELREQLESQRKYCASRPMICSQNFLPSRTFNWLLIALIVLFGGVYTVAGTNAINIVSMDKKIEQHAKEVPGEKFHELEERLKRYDMFKRTPTPSTIDESTGE